MKLKIMFLLPVIFLYAQVSAKQKDKKEMQFAFTFGINNYGSEAFDLSALCKKKVILPIVPGLALLIQMIMAPLFLQLFLMLVKYGQLKTAGFLLM